MSDSFHMLIFYVPVEQAEEVKEAVFKAGGGRLGNYDSCCWQTTGQGQFRPLAGSKPFLGSQDRIEKVPEARVELICSKTNLPAAISALKNVHPYETPAFAHWPIQGM